MGWFWRTSDNGKSSSSSDDPLRNLDPALRDFLAKESPVKYGSSNPESLSGAATTLTAQPEQQLAPKQHSPEAEAENTSQVPPQSLFKDGRYSHLWSTYHPQAEVEAAFKSDAEKINDILEGYKQRKAEIGRAALENCALEQWSMNECFRSGGVMARMTMCRAENRKFERCYAVQAKFLKALGYLCTYDRPQEVDEKIQMHADKLYHQMLSQEAAIEAAKAEGRPIPSFPPLVASPIAGVAPKSNSAQIKTSHLSPAIQAKMKKHLDGHTEEERVVEEQAMKAEIQAGGQVASQLGIIYQKEEEERRTRMEQGRETIGDKLLSIFKWK